MSNLIQNLSYFVDGEKIIYQVYGYIQPENRILAQISYVPNKFAYGLDVKKADIFGETYVKWTPLVDILGVEEYVALISERLPSYVRSSWLASQIVEINQQEIRIALPLVKYDKFAFSSENFVMFNKMLEEFELNLEDVYFSSLTPFTSPNLFSKKLNSTFDDPKKDIDLYIFGKENSLKVKRKLRRLRDSEISRFNVRRGNTGELIPHRLLCNYFDKQICLDFLFSPLGDEIPILFDFLSREYDQVVGCGVDDGILEIVDDSVGYSYPQLFGINHKRADYLITSCHRYDYLFNGNFNYKDGKLFKIKDLSFLVVQEYGNLKGEQTKLLER